MKFDNTKEQEGGSSSSGHAMASKRTPFFRSIFYSGLPYILQAIAWPIAHTIFRLNGTFTVHGYENIKDLKGPIIFASNHYNEMDPVIQRAVIPMLSRPAPLFWVSRPRNHYTWKGWRSFLYGEWFFRAWGAYPAYKGSKDYKQSLQHHIKILNDGYSMGIFPQGMNEKEQGRGAKVHGGVAFLSHFTNTPVVPVTIQGTLGLDAHKLFIGRSDLEIHIGKPIYVSSDNYQEEAKKVVDSLYTVLD